MRKSIRLFCLAALVASFILVPIQGVYAEEYYKGKKIEIIISSGPPGTGTDIVCRAILKHLGKFIPGNPTVIINYMPGGGGTIGANYIYNIAKKDGTTVFFGAGMNAMGSIIRIKGARYDYGKMTPALALGSGAIGYAKTQIVKKPEDIVRAKGLIFGASPPPSMVTIFMLLSYEVFDNKAERVIFGYSSTTGGRLAFLQGETNIMCETAPGYLKNIKPLVDKGEVTPVWQSGLLNEAGEVIREPSISDVMTVLEVYQKVYGKDPSGKAWEAFKMVIGGVANLSKAFLFPPGTEKYADIFADACEKMAKDPGFMADMQKVAPGNPIYVGEQLKNIWKTSKRQISPEAVDWLRNWLKNDYDVALEP